MAERMSTRSLTSVKKRNKLKRTSSECSDAFKFEVELIEDNSVIVKPQKNKSTTKTPKARKVLALSSSDENPNKVTDRVQTEKKPSKKVKRVKKIRNTENLVALFNDEEDNSFSKVAEKVAETRKVKKKGFPTFIPSVEGFYNDANDDTDDRENEKVVVKTTKAKKAKKNKKKSKNPVISVDNVSSTTPENGLETSRFLLQRQGSLIVLLNNFLRNKLPDSSSQSKPIDNEDSQSPETSEKESSFEVASNDPEAFLSEKVENDQFKDTPGRGTYVKTPAKSLINSPVQFFDALGTLKDSEDENGIQEDPETYLSLNLENNQFKDTPGRETYVKTPGKNLVSSPTPLNNTLKSLSNAKEENNLTQDQLMNNNFCESNKSSKKGATKASPTTGINNKATKLPNSKINQRANKKHSYGSLTSNRNNSSEANNDENQSVFNNLNITITTRRAPRKEILRSDSTSTGSENDFVTVRKPNAGISFDANSVNNTDEQSAEEESSTLIETTNMENNTVVDVVNNAYNNESIIELSSDSEPSTILNNTGLTTKSNESISDKKLIRMDTFTKDEEDTLIVNNQRRKSTRRKWSDVMKTPICGSVPPSVIGDNPINSSHMAKNKSVTFSLVLPDIPSAENKENDKRKIRKNSLVNTDASLLTPRPPQHVPRSFRKTPKPGSSKWPDSFVSGNCAASSTPLYMSKNESFNEINNSKTAKTSPKQRSKVKMPNFKKIHEKLADKMENLQEMQERKAKRAQYLLSNSKSVVKTNTPNKTVVEKESKRKLIYTPGKLGHSHLININKTDISNNSPNSRRNLINLPKPLQERIIKRSSIEKIKQLHSKIPTKAGSKENIKELSNNANKKKKLLLEKQKLKPKSVTKFGFKVDENVKVSKEDQIKAFTGKTKLINNNRERNRNQTVEVRTNRRFELLMQMRAKNMNKK